VTVKSPDYSPFARQYAHSRPMYPARLFSCLSSLVERHDLAWDCATGSGQAARTLIEYFDRVIATDISPAQVEEADPHPRIDYRVAKSEQSGLPDHCIDLITAASALHWFDLDRFYAEARRVMRPGGVLAAWTYHVGYVEPPFDEVFGRFYRDVVAPYFAPGARLVDNRYEDITLPGKAISTPEFFVSVNWTLDQTLAFIRSWSGTQQYMKERNEDPVVHIAGELDSLWTGKDAAKQIRWPLYIRVARF